MSEFERALCDIWLFGVAVAIAYYVVNRFIK